MPLTKFVTSLIFIFLISVASSACSYIPWVGDDGVDEDEISFEDDTFFEGEDESAQSDSEDFFFEDTGESNDGSFASVDQETDANEIKADMETLQSQQELLVEKVRELQEVLDDLEPKVAQTQELLEGNLGAVSEQASFLEPEVHELRVEMDQLKEELAALKSGRGTPRRTSGAHISTGFEREYGRALSTYRSNNYDESILLFQNLAMKNPPLSYQDNIAFWIGNNYAKLEMYDDAIQQFQVVLNRYPRGNKVHDSRYMLGVSHYKKGDSSRAIDILESALNDNPPAEVRGKIMKQLSQIQ